MKMLFALAGAFLTIVSAPIASAQDDYPARQIRILIGFPAGAGPDIVARMIGDKLTKKWGKPIIVESVPGASGNIAADRVVRSAPDGYTLFLSANAAIVINPGLYPKLPYRPMEDLVPIMQLALQPNLLVVHPDLAVHNVPELVDYARAHSGEVTFASVGLGTSQHLGGEYLKAMAHIDIRHVPYRGSNQVMADFLAGRLTMWFCAIPIALPQVQEGKLRAIAVSSPARLPFLPDIPTVSEQGYPGFDVSSWLGLLAPAHTPPAVVEKLQTEVATIFSDPEIRQKVEAMGMQVVAGTSAEFATVIKTETPKWTAFIKEVGISMP